MDIEAEKDRRAIEALTLQLTEVREDAPTTSLARLKAEWQAEWLEAITDDMRSKSKELATIGVLDALAAKRRRQAEEADQ